MGVCMTENNFTSRHGVTNICYSPERQRMASGSADYAVKVWDNKIQTCRTTLFFNSTPILVAFIKCQPQILLVVTKDARIFTYELTDS